MEEDVNNIYISIFIVGNVISQQHDGTHYYVNLLPLNNPELIRIYLLDNYDNKTNYDIYVQKVLNNKNIVSQVTESSTEKSFRYDLGGNIGFFGANFLKHVSLIARNNFLISPLAVELSSNVFVETAIGKTREEIIGLFTLYIPASMSMPSRYDNRNKSLTILSSLHEKSLQYICRLGVNIYIAPEQTIRQRTMAFAQQFYGTEISNINFSDPGAVANISQMISNITEEVPDAVTISDLIKEPMTVISALNFKGIWLQKFNTAPIQPLNLGFTVAPSISKRTAFMNVKSRFYLAKPITVKAKVLKLPYKGNKFSMYLVLPNELMNKNGLSTIALELRNERLKFNEVLIDLTLPKFKFHYSSDSVIDEALMRMELKEAYSDLASFPGLSRGGTVGPAVATRLKLSKTLQWTRLNFNEFGSTSSTTTGEIETFGDFDIDEKVTADKPFLFFICDDTTHTVILAGRVSDPTRTENGFLV